MKTILIISSPISSCVIQKLKTTINYFFPGIFTNSIIDGHLTIPRKVSSNGELLSHNLSHHHEHNHYDATTGDAESHAVHYHIDLHNETLHLELE